jgi:hypothetical protein
MASAEQPDPTPESEPARSSLSIRPAAVSRQSNRLLGMIIAAVAVLVLIMTFLITIMVHYVDVHHGL